MKDLEKRCIKLWSVLHLFPDYCYKFLSMFSWQQNQIFNRWCESFCKLHVVNMQRVLEASIRKWNLIQTLQKKEIKSKGKERFQVMIYKTQSQVAYRVADPSCIMESDSTGLLFAQCRLPKILIYHKIHAIFHSAYVFWPYLHPFPTHEDPKCRRGEKEKGSFLRAHVYYIYKAEEDQATVQ